MTVAQALAQVALNLKIAPITHVPGYGASQVFAACAPHLPSFHEEVALGLSLGAALSGRPSLCLIKLQGLLKAANALVCGLSAGVSAGCTIAVFDDPLALHSDNQLEAETVIAGLEIACDRPASPQEAPEMLGGSLRLSQQQGLPRLLLLPADWMEQPFTGSLPKIRLDPAPWRPHPQGELVCPLFAGYQRQRLLARLRGGPLPSPPPMASLDQLPLAWQSSLESYRPFVERMLQLGRPEFVAGDTGLSSLFGLAPYRAVDAIGWMGGSLPLALGALAGGATSAWAISGDFSFLAAGHLGWLEARRRGLPLRVFLFDNGCAQATGGQPVEPHLLGEMLSGPQVISVSQPDQLVLNPPSPSDRGPWLYWIRLAG